MPRITAPSSVAIRLRYLTPRIHDKGTLALFELLLELAAKSSGVRDRCEAYANINEHVLDLYGGRRLGPTLWRVK